MAATVAAASTNYIFQADVAHDHCYLLLQLLSYSTAISNGGGNYCELLLQAAHTNERFCFLCLLRSLLLSCAARPSKCSISMLAELQAQ
jgi:hypothetical protein